MFRRSFAAPSLPPTDSSRGHFHSKAATGGAGWQRRVLALMPLLLAAWMAGTLWRSSAPGYPTAVLDNQARFEEVTGLRIVRVMLTAPRGIVDVRYQVLDPDKSLVIFDDDDPPVVINAITGVELNLPVEQHHFEQQEMARIYRLHILNPDRAVKRGERVSVRIGDVQVDNLIVE